MFCLPTLECPFLHAYFFMMCTSDQNILFYALWTVFYENFYIFFLIWSLLYFPLENMKTTSSWYWYIQCWKMSIFKSRKNQEKSPFSHISFYRTYYFGKMHIFKNIFLKNACNLGHSNPHFFLEQIGRTIFFCPHPPAK